MREPWRVVVLLLLGCSIAGTARAQQGCEAPALAQSASAPNIFSPTMESAWGDLVAADISGQVRVTDDPAVTSYLSKIAARLERELPPNQIQFHFYLMDLPYPNAFSISGGWIYVSQKLVGFVKNEDELAGVLGHEMGHLVTHQLTVELTAKFKNVLGVTEIESRDDLTKDLELLDENWRRDPQVFRKISRAEPEGEWVADQVGLYTMARAGYSPQSFADVFNRLVGTEWKTGNWFTDMFYETTPNMKRLRLEIETLKSLPPGCIARPEADTADFKNWQQKVLAFSGWKKQQILPGLERQVTLSPPLEADLTQLRFSPDGKFILAQDSGAIYVLKRDPLGLLFEIPAEKAWPASFTPDSQAVVFADSSLEVEKWGLSSRERESLSNIVVGKGCWQVALAPDGKTLACLQPDAELKLIDVPSGETIFSVKDFSPLPELFGIFIFHTFGDMEFSPDGQTFLAAASRWRVVDFNVARRESQKLHGVLSSNLPGEFAFLGSDRIVVRDRTDRVRAVVVSFPQGKELGQCIVGYRTFSAPTLGDDLIIDQPDPNHPEGILDIKTGKFVFGNKAGIMDVYGNAVVAEDPAGNIRLFDLTTHNLSGPAPLPRTGLGYLAAATVSPDLKWLALSETSHGGVWNLETGERKYLVRRFDGAWIDGESAVYADFPKFEKAAHVIGALDLQEDSVSSLGEVTDKHSWQFGRYFSVLRTKKDSGPFDHDTTREIRDVHTGQVLWSRHFPEETPGLGIEPDTGAGVLFWRSSAAAAKEEAAKFPAVAEACRDDKDKKNDYFAEAFDIASGKSLGAALVDTGRGSFGIRDIFARGGRLYVAATTGEVLVYSLATGKRLGQVLGAAPVISDAASLMAVLAEPAVIEVYDLHAFTLTKRLTFLNPVVLCGFSQDGKTLMALTSKQTAYFLDVSKSSPASEEAAR
jgi:WD40 repeat protein